MTLYLSNRDGNGKTSEEGHYKFQTAMWSGSVLGSSALQVSQNSPTGMSVLVSAGQMKIDTSSEYAYTGWNTAPSAVNISTADSANPRVSTIVAYVDRAAATSASPPNNPGIIKLMSVNGTPAAVPVAPNGAVIQSAVGIGNPYIVLADVRANAAVSQILNASITDRRTQVTLGSNLVGTSSLTDKAVTGSKIDDQTITSTQLASLAATTAKLADGAVTTPKFKPTTINSNFTPAGSRYSNSSIGYFVVPNCSMTYTAGSTNETLILWTSIMAYKSSGNAEMLLYVNGVAYGTAAYLEAQTIWYRASVMNFVNVNAGQTVTLAVVIYNPSTATILVTNETPRWMPAIQGFSIYRP